jgi:hypothetical protein
MFAEDLSEFLDSTEMADNATIGTSTVAGIFENQFVEVHGIEGVRPVFVCIEADVPSITHGDALTINATSYKVAGVQPDGTGLTSLILEKQ